MTVEGNKFSTHPLEWKAIGWSYDDMILESKIELEEIKFAYTSLPKLDSQTMTVSFDLDPDVGWVCVSIEREEDVYTDSAIFMIKMNNIISGEQKKILCRVSHELIATGQAKNVILNELTKYLTPQQIKSFIIFVDKQGMNWVQPEPLYAPGGLISYTFDSEGNTISVDNANINPAPSLVNSLPGLFEHVKHPVTGEQVLLRTTIINLNDVHKWTRDQIADWLDEISDPTGENGPNLCFDLESEV